MLGMSTAAAEPWPAYLNSGSMNSGITFIPRALALGIDELEDVLAAHLGIGGGEVLDEGVGVVLRPRLDVAAALHGVGRGHAVVGPALQLLRRCGGRP